MSARWDPDRYLAYAEERSRPFADLLARVDADPGWVVDLGCGPGHLTELLLARWPRARVTGVDASVEMVERARAHAAATGLEPTAVDYVHQDLRGWRSATPVDLLVSASTLQWVPGHLALLPRLIGMLSPGGTMAFTVPANFDQPSHVLLRDLAARAPYAAWTADVAHPGAYDALTYLDELADAGFGVDAWETTYLHLLDGPDPVLRWVSGTGARPVLQALPAGLRARFEAEYAATLRAAYPARAYGTVLPFRRVFVLARRPPAPPVSQVT